MDCIDFDPDELDAASDWHGGMASMLYAIASTGSLRRGTIRPRVDCDDCGGRGWDRVELTQRCRTCRGAYMTDEQWLVSLATRLEGEAEDAARDAREQATLSRVARRSSVRCSELREQAIALDGIAAKCRAAIGNLNAEAA